ncbi:hypothetical protein EMPS_03869 [Entomortierella parvispora]|uniref:Transcription activator GCR1-like domain-containing protein n=1 Tax=Entomortierella parvispora TaxID=205924 RepID=A0A9P3H7E0_9FUNG|nr:hypothetical protein EMPS_03869 [Entomortierella parvispora]
MIGSFHFPSSSSGQSSGSANGHANAYISKRHEESPSEDETETKKRAARAATLPKEDKGLIYWEDWCNENELSKTPTLETVMLYAKEFVAPLEERMEILSRHNPTVSRLNGIRDFMVPLAKLVERSSQSVSEQSSPTTFSKPTSSWRSKGKEVVRSRDLSTAASPPMEDTSVDSTPDRTQSLPVASTLPAAPPVSRTRQPTEIMTAVQVAAKPTKTVEPVSNRGNGSNDAQSDYSQFKAHEFLEPPVSGKGKGGFVGRPPSSTTVTTYRLNPRVITVPDVLQEWRFGFEGGPSIQSLYRKFGSKWKFTGDGFRFSSRAAIVREYVRLVRKQGESDEEAIRSLEHARNGHSITTFYQSLVAQRRAPEGDDTPREKIQRSSSLEDHSSTRSTPTNSIHQQGIIPVIKKRKRVSHANDTSAYEGPVRAVTSRSRSSVHQVKFPFPVHNLDSVADVWKEWTEGWEDEPAIEHLVEIHGPAWEEKIFSAEYFKTFHNNSRLVRTIREAVLKGAVGSHEEAVEMLERARKSDPLAKFFGSRAYNSVLSSWDFNTRRTT